MMGIRIVHFQLSTCTATLCPDPLLGWGCGHLSVECGQNWPVSWRVIDSFAINREPNLSVIAITSYQFTITIPTYLLCCNWRVSVICTQTQLGTWTLLSGITVGLHIHAALYTAIDTVS